MTGSFVPSALLDLAAVRIGTPRLRLRPPVATDHAALALALGHWRVVRWLARVPFPYRTADAERFVAATAGDLAARRALPLLIFDRDGLAGCVWLDGLGAAPEFGYWLAPSRWGRGYATEAGRAALAFAFASLDAAAIRSGVFEGNDASMAVQRRLGFEISGTRSVFCLARGADLPHIDTVLTRERFSALDTAQRETFGP